MPTFYLVSQTRSGTQRTLLHLQEYGIDDASELHLDAEKKHKRTIKNLKLDENLPGIKSTQPLFHLEPPYSVELEVEGLEVVRADETADRTRVRRGLGAVPLTAAGEIDGFTMFMTTPGGQSYSVRLWTDPTQYEGQYAVWRVAVTVMATRIRSMHIAGMVTAARIHHVMDVLSTDHIECETCGRKKPPQPKKKPVRAEICDHIDATIASAAMTDAALMSAFHVAYAIEADHSLYATDAGHSLLTANSSPAAALRMDPESWVARVSEQIHARPDFGVAYRSDAAAFQQQLTEGVVDYFRDAWSGTVRGIKVSVQKFMPSAETIATLKSINVKKLADRTRSVLTSKSVDALVATLTTNPNDIAYLEAWGAAVLGDLKLDESQVGQLIIDNAPAVEKALRSVIAKMQLLKPSDLEEYGAQFRALIGNPDLADGVSQLAAVAKHAAKFAARNADKAAAAARTVVNLAAAGAGAVATSGQ